MHLAERLLPEQLAVGVQAVEAVRTEEGVYPLTVGNRRRRRETGGDLQNIIDRRGSPRNGNLISLVIDSQ